MESALSDFLEAYGAALLVLLLLLCASALPAMGFAIALRDYVSLLTPRLTEHWSPLGEWTYAGLRGGIGFGLLFSGFGFALVGSGLAGLYLSGLPAGSRSAVFPWLVAIAFMYPFVRELRSIRSDYLAYRRSADFRVWIRGVPKVGLCAAHEYYLMGWRNRVIGDAFSLTTLCGFVGLGLLVVAKVWGRVPMDRRGWIVLGASLLAALTVPVVRGVVTRSWVALRPEYGLADLCTRPGRPRAPVGEAPPTFFVVHRPGAWRGSLHEDSFKIAKLVEWSVRRAQERYAPHHYDEIVLAARRLAQSFRLNALRGDTEAGGAAHEERKFLALQLTTGRDPLAFVGRIAELTAGEPDPPELPRARAARVVEALSGAINVHWPAVKIVAVLLALVLLVSSGKLMDAVGLLK